MTATNLKLSSQMITAAMVLANARRLLDEHVTKQVALGKREIMVRAGVKAHMQKIAISQGSHFSADDLERICGC